MSAGLLEAPTHGIRRWYAMLAGIGWWMLHLVTEASLVRQSCLHPGWRVVMHLVTLATALGTILAIWWSYQVARSCQDAADDRTDPPSRDRFYGMFGLALGTISLLLILWEGAYAVVLNSCKMY